MKTDQLRAIYKSFEEVIDELVDTQLWEQLPGYVQQSMLAHRNLIIESMKD